MALFRTMKMKAPEGLQELVCCRGVPMGSVWETH